MGQSKPLAVVVEDDDLQRQLASVVLEEECDMEVVSCATAEAAIVILYDLHRQPAMLFTDVRLAGVLTGADLAQIVHEKFPDARLLVTSGDDLPPPLPDGARFMPKPWAPRELAKEAAALG
jgi:DNA-binding NarL/FixJ family response regulator